MKCIDPTQKVGYLVDDCSPGIYVQKMDTDEDIDNEEKTVSNLF